jgi:nucleoside-diphosphate-sugar epimerase
MDVSRINELGWTASTGLEEGIRLVYEWYRGQRSVD